MMVEITAKESPFSPGQPVQPEYFVARIKEIQRLERAIRQTVSGRNENIFITGPRGIGKSSLALFIRYLAEKEYCLIGSHCYLGGVRSLDEMMGVTFQKLLQDCTDKSLFDKLREIFDDYIAELKFFGMGVEFTKDKSKLHTLVNNFLPALRKIYDEAKKNGKKGLILILDDLNGISDVPQFSQFLKSRVDELATSGKPLPIFLVLVGLPERRDELIKHQPSVARIFDVVDLPPMSNSESEDFFINMFSKQNITVTSEALYLMVGLSGGFPMLMHEIGDSVFWQDSDQHIDGGDAVIGIAEAAISTGKKYIDPQISKMLRNKTYTSILRKISEMPSGFGTTFERQQILQEIPQHEQKNLDNFLKRSRELGIIEAAEARGEYRFVNPLYHLYVWNEFQNKRK
ncbi:MAG: ATP-binding protein [Planctomycetota bacterium]